MPSIKRLRSVVHSVGQHSVSGLCYVHPHLGQACKTTNTRSAKIDLIEGIVRTPGIELDRPVILGTRALSEKFVEILLSEGLDRDDIASAKIEFQFNCGRYPSSCYVRVETKSGIAVDDAIDSAGNRAEIVDVST